MTSGHNPKAADAVVPPAAPVLFGRIPLTVEDLVAGAAGARVHVSEDVDYRAHLEASVTALSAALARGERVYGVTTGFGDSCDNDVGDDDLRALAVNLVRFHRCGTGRAFDRGETRAILVARLASLSRGYSAVRPVVLDTIAAMLNADLCPRIPSEGSVGASGDLTPLSYVAAALMGEGEIATGGRLVPAAEALRAAGLRPIELMPKESLALMNGTSAMTGLAGLGFDRARHLARFAAALTALAVEALRGEPGHFDDRIFELKPHEGQRTFARWVREDLGPAPPARPPGAKLQDRYSIRCAPHVGGVLLDVLPLARRFIEVELNSVNDNPIFHVESGDVLHGGNFYGGHVCHAADMLKSCVANLADLFDRQFALVGNPGTNGGLPRDLVLTPEGGRTAHHGFKAMQITASALTAEALKLTMPASVFSRSTENHNQDKVSMGTIAARELLRVVELTETVAAIHVLALCQAMDLRGGPLGPRARAIHAAVREGVAVNSADRAMDADIAWVLSRYRAGTLPLSEVGLP